jgi:hypothetical protein
MNMLGAPKYTVNNLSLYIYVPNLYTYMRLSFDDRTTAPCVP